MSREIKFRAWDKLGEADSYDIFNLAELMSGKWQYSRYENWGQYTGLKDKNGKEIFEGDIVKDTYYTSIIRFGIADVEDNEMYSSNIVCGFYKEDIKTGEERHMDHIESSEVIGNIWENPDLLKGEPNE